jgi:hypothetical protein
MMRTYSIDGGAMTEFNPTQKRIFSFEEALEVFPRAKEITTEAIKRATLLSAEMLVLSAEGGRRAELEEEYSQVLHQWVHAIEDLGCEVKGLWLVDFDNGEGYYCWKYPEERLEYFHDYTSGFSGRIKIK